VNLRNRTPLRACEPGRTGGQYTYDETSRSVGWDKVFPDPASRREPPRTLRSSK